MALANTDFKVGDRVHYFGYSCGEEDYGTVVPDDANILTLPGKDSFWVKWDSDGSIFYVNPREVELVQRNAEVSVQTTAELTVQNCIDFLISQGYTVSLSKN